MSGSKQVFWNGTKVELRSMDEAPMDGTGILVLLEAESLGRVWHTASLRENYKLVGHQFSWDCSKMLGWIPLPEVM